MSQRWRSLFVTWRRWRSSSFQSLIEVPTIFFETSGKAHAFKGGNDRISKTLLCLINFWNYWGFPDTLRKHATSTWKRTREGSRPRKRKEKGNNNNIHTNISVTIHNCFEYQCSQSGLLLSLSKWLFHYFHYYNFFFFFFFNYGYCSHFWWQNRNCQYSDCAPNFRVWKFEFDNTTAIEQSFALRPKPHRQTVSRRQFRWVPHRILRRYSARLLQTFSLGQP